MKGGDLMLWFIMSVIAYGSLGLGVVVCVYSALTISSDIDDIEGSDFYE